MSGVVPDYSGYTGGLVEAHTAEVNESLATYVAQLEAIKLRAGLATVLHISALGNRLLQDNRLDNRLLTDEPDRCAAVIALALNHLHLLACIISPYMPSTAESILRQLGIEPTTTTTPNTTTTTNAALSIPDVWDPTAALKPGHKIGEPKLLFSNIPTARMDEWREAFGGEELRRQKAVEAEKAAAKKAAKEREKERKKQKKLAIREAAAGGTTSTAAPAAPAVPTNPPTEK